MVHNIVKIVVLHILLCTISVSSIRRRRSTILSHSPQESISNDEWHDYVEKNFTVPIDHFNSSAKATFQMRYLINDTWQKGGNAPIFFYTGNEGDITQFVESAAFIYEIAPLFGALIVFAEHRYYGESLPFGNDSLLTEENRSYLSVQQAMEDYIDLINSLKSDLSMKYSPVIVFGGSYGGMLSAWMRMKYPQDILGAIASSAPVLQFDGVRDCHGYYRTVTSVFREAGEHCPDIIRRSWSAIDNVTSTDEGGEWLSEEWNLCNVIINETDVQVLKNWLENGYTTLATENYPYESSSLPANPINAFCNMLNDTADTDEDILLSLKEAIMILPNLSDDDDCIDPDKLDPILDTWLYQTCSEIPLNLCTDGIHDMFEAAPWNFKEFSDECASSFNVKPEVDLACKRYGCANFNVTSNIVFTNGLLDPWHTGGILENVSDSVIAVIIPEGAHQLDLAANHPDDPKSVREARKIHIKFIRKWIREYNKTTIPSHIQRIKQKK